MPSSSPVAIAPVEPRPGLAGLLFHSRFRLALGLGLFLVVLGSLTRLALLLAGPSEGTRSAAALLRIFAAGGVLDLAFVGLGRTLKDQAMPVLFRVELPKNGVKLGELPAVAVGQTLKVLAQTRASQAGVAIPAAAVVRNAANESVVWVHESAERFASRKVKVAALDGHSVAVTDGLNGGERVVVQGAAALAQIR